MKVCRLHIADNSWRMCVNRHQYAIHQNNSKRCCFGAAKKDRLTNLVTGYVNVVRHWAEISGQIVKKNVESEYFLIKIYVLPYPRLRSVPKSPIYFINYVRWHALPFLRLASSHPPAITRPTIRRPLFKQLFFLQLFTSETNARQFVTKLAFFYFQFLFLFLFNSHHMRVQQIQYIAKCVSR